MLNSFYNRALFDKNVSLFNLYAIRVGLDNAATSRILVQFNSIQFDNFIPDSTEHIQQVYVTLRSICYIRHTICAVYKSTEQCIKETCIQLFQSSVYIQKLVNPAVILIL